MHLRRSTPRMRIAEVRTRSLSSTLIPSRIAVLVLLLGAAGTCTLLPRAAYAQSCHAASLRPSDASDDDNTLGYRVAVAGLLGNFVTETTRGEYQGILLTATVSHHWFTAEVTLPGFRIAQVGSHAYGLGDVLVNARGNLYHSRDDTLIVGPELAATLPSGSMEDGLGMGHTMLMPGAFMQWHQGAFSVVAQLAYGRAVGGGEHAGHDMGPMPIVNPMNRSELEHAVGASARVHPNLAITGRLLGAVTLFQHDGASREILAPGLQLLFGAFDASLEIQVPVVGTPFTSRTLLSVGAQW